MRFDAGRVECLQHFQTLGIFLDLGFRTGFRQIGAYRLDFGGHVKIAQQRADTFRTHCRAEFVTILFSLGEIVILGQQLAAGQRGHAGFGHHIGFEIQHAFDIAQGHVQHHAQPRRKRLQEPDVRYRAGQFDMPHALAPDLGQSHFHTAFFADHTAMLEALVLAAQAFIVLHRPEDLGAEQTVAFRLEGAVIDGFRLLDFAVGPGADLFRGSQTDLDRIEFFLLCDLLEQIQQ